MALTSMANLPIFILSTQETTNFISYVVAFALATALGIILYRLFHSDREEIQLEVPSYPFFKSAGRTAADGITHSQNSENTSTLYAYLCNIDKLTPVEFEFMVVETFKLKRWEKIQAISQTNKKGWDVTGLDEAGRLTYIKVHYDSSENNKVELHSVQEFQTARLIGRSQRAIFIANSSSRFVDQAKEYARKENIELIDGSMFEEMCQQILDGAPHSDKLTRPINKASLELETHQFIDRAIFSFPTSSSTFISRITSSKVTFSPHQYYQFGLYEQFFDNMRGWSWDMDYKDHILVNLPSLKWHAIENGPLSETTDLNDLTQKLEKEGLGCSIEGAPQINKISAVKDLIQQATATEKSYKDQKIRTNKQYSKVCTADASNIEVRTSAVFWGSVVDMKVKIGTESGNELELQLHEGKVSKILNQDNFEDILDKSTVLCQECQKITASVKYFRILDYCQSCGKVLCENCGHTESKSHWCSECWSQIEEGRKEKSKNKEAISKLKSSFDEWQREAQ
ncbi:MAG: restriction endonuclease [Promethearchaeota archaeon]